MVLKKFDKFFIYKLTVMLAIVVTETQIEIDVPYILFQSFFK